MDIGGYSIVSHWWLFYWWLLIAIFLVVINGYFINVYWWLLYYKLLLVIICYITSLGDYSIINYCSIFYVIIS
jgi:hypothetical protein